MLRIANHLGIPEEELFKRFLVIDYTTTVSGKKYHYLCPARQHERPGRIVKHEWAFSDSPCIFLRENGCVIQKAKPRGGREFFCRLLTHSQQNPIGYGKKAAAYDWNTDPLNG